MVIDVARHLAGLAGANSAEFDPDAEHPVIATMADQVGVIARRGRHGRHDAPRVPTRRSSRRAAWRRALTASCSSPTATATATRSTTPTASGSSTAGLRFSGTSPDGHLVEVVELPAEVHPFYVGTQAHPEFTSRPTKAHPLFRAFIEAAVARSESKLLDLVAR